jgi:hypothetical protein
MFARQRPSPPVSASKSACCDDGAGGNSGPMVLSRRFPARLQSPAFERCAPVRREDRPRRLGYSRNAVCAKLTRLDLKRRHKPPTAKPKIRPVPKRRPALLTAGLEHRNQIGHSHNSLRGRSVHFLSAGVRATRVRKYPADSDVGGAVRRERQLVTRPFGHVKPKVRRRLTPLSATLQAGGGGDSGDNRYPQ